MTDNADDLAIWERLFADVPAAWRDAPPSQAMLACRAFLTEHRVRTLVDAGCGVGRYAVFLARHGFSVSAFDFSANAIRHARAWAEEEGLQIDFACASLEQRPFSDEFDAAVAALVLDNVTTKDMRVGLAQLLASLRPGGLLFAVFNPATMPTSIVAANPTTGVTRIRYTDDELRGELTGFELLRMETFELGTRGLYLRRS